MIATMLTKEEREAEGFNLDKWLKESRLNLKGTVKLTEDIDGNLHFWQYEDWEEN